MKHTPNFMVWLVVGLPVVSVLMGVVTVYIAISTGDSVVTIEQAPLSKTSWKELP